MVEYRQGVGPERLPQGAATEVNREDARLRDVASRGAFQADEVPIEFAPDNDDEAIPDGALGENMGVLLSDPDEGYRPRLMARDRPGRVPRYIVRHLPTLMAAARDPAAPPTLRAYFNAIVRQLDAEMRSGA